MITAFPFLSFCHNNSAIFLFAHQDDEYGVFAIIEEELRNGRDVWCLYFTDGGDKCHKRNSESLNVLIRMGVSDSKIKFIGEELEIKDGNLLFSIEKCAAWLREILSDQENIAVLYVPAWEGGHLDHDVLNFVATNVMHELGVLGKLFQFPLYNAFGVPKPFFRVMAPLRENGEVIEIIIPLLRRFKFVFNCLRYSSQLTSWIGLFPFVAFSYLVIGRQYIQAVSFDRLMTRPHNGVLYYEARQIAKWSDVKKIMSSYVEPKKIPINI
jgi:LmbE family N-acetylglucosaminyl deacetylase